MEFLKCPNCNSELSSRFEYYNTLKVAILKHLYKTVDIKKIKYDSQIQDVLNNAFSVLHLEPKAQCCRLHLGSAKIFNLDELDI